MRDDATSCASVSLWLNSAASASNERTIGLPHRTSAHGAAAPAVRAARALRAPHALHALPFGGEGAARALSFGVRAALAAALGRGPKVRARDGRGACGARRRSPRHDERGRRAVRLGGRAAGERQRLLLPADAA